MAYSFKIPLKTVKVLREVGLLISDERKESDYEPLTFKEQLDKIQSDYQHLYTMAEYGGESGEEIPEQVIRESLLELAKTCVALLEDINTTLGLK